jgi:hypothetical protein
MTDERYIEPANNIKQVCRSVQCTHKEVNSAEGIIRFRLYNELLYNKY